MAARFPRVHRRLSEAKRQTSSLTPPRVKSRSLYAVETSPTIRVEPNSAPVHTSASVCTMLDERITVVGTVSMCAAKLR
jgi:hypothetical protein